MYRRTLTNAAKRILAANAGFTLGLLGLFEGKTRLEARLDHLSRPAWKHKGLRRAVALVAVMALAVFVVPMARPQEVLAEPAEISAGDEAVAEPAAPETAAPALPKMELAGRVLDQYGEPAANVEIIAHPFRPREGQLPPVSVTTGEDGTFSAQVPLPRPGAINHYLLVARRADKIGIQNALWWPEGTAFEPVEVWMAPVDTLAGKVTGPDGSAASGLTVKLWTLDPRGSYYKGQTIFVTGIYPSSDADYTTQTGPDGSFVIRNLPRGWLADIALSGESHGDTHHKMTVGAGETLIQLAEGAKVSGRVVAKDDGVRAADISILVKRITDSDHTIPDRSATSGTDGTFSLDDLRHGQVYVTAMRDWLRDEETWAYIFSGSVTLEAGKTTEVTVEVCTGVKVTGRVLDKATGQPCAQGFAAATAPDAKVYVPTGHSNADENGRFTLYLAPGRHSLYVSASMTDTTIATDVQRVITVTDGEDMDLGDFEIEFKPRTDR